MSRSKKHVAPRSSTNAGVIAGSVVGGALLLILSFSGSQYYKKTRTASASFVNGSMDLVMPNGSVSTYDASRHVVDDNGHHAMAHVCTTRRLYTRDDEPKDPTAPDQAAMPSISLSNQTSRILNPISTGTTSSEPPHSSWLLVRLTDKTKIETIDLQVTEGTREAPSVLTISSKGLKVSFPKNPLKIINWINLENTAMRFFEKRLAIYDKYKKKFTGIIFDKTILLGELTIPRLAKPIVPRFRADIAHDIIRAVSYKFLAEGGSMVVRDTGTQLDANRLALPFVGDKTIATESMTFNNFRTYAYAGL